MNVTVISIQENISHPGLAEIPAPVEVTGSDAIDGGLKRQAIDEQYLGAGWGPTRRLPNVGACFNRHQFHWSLCKTEMYFLTFMVPLIQSGSGSAPPSPPTKKKKKYLTEILKKISAY